MSDNDKPAIDPAKNAALSDDLMANVADTLNNLIDLSNRKIKEIEGHTAQTNHTKDQTISKIMQSQLNITRNNTPIDGSSQNNTNDNLNNGISSIEEQDAPNPKHHRHHHHDDHDDDISLETLESCADVGYGKYMATGESRKIVVAGFPKSGAMWIKGVLNEILPYFYTVTYTVRCFIEKPKEIWK